MKQLFTSYYAKNGAHRQAVAISLFAPSFFRRRWYPKLAPTRRMIDELKDGIIDEVEYTTQYLQLLKLRQLSPQQIADDLEEGSILCCYESSEKFCHRHIVAAWLERGANVVVTELIDPTPPSLVDELVEF